jgi:uncharacterized protein (TIGR00730 family)
MMNSKIRNNIIVSVFGSSHPKEGDDEYSLAYEVGSELATAGFTVCNGGYGGTMEASARGAKDAGGKTIGIISKSFVGRKANRWIDTTLEVNNIVERLLKLISVADAYVVLKGGTGTLLELAAVWELMNKNVILEKPIVVIGNFWNSVVKVIHDELVREGSEDATRFITAVDNPKQCAECLRKNLQRKEK